MISDIGYRIFFTRYISLGLFIATLIVLVLPFVKGRSQKE